MLEVYLETANGASFGVVCDGEEVFASNFGVNSADLMFSFRKMFPDENLRAVEKPYGFGKKAVSVVKGIWEGKGVAEEVPLNLARFPPYTQRVLRAVARIPVGYVTSYGGVAYSVGGGARAVGNAMAKNCFAPLVPCHRVVTSSFGLGGYGGAGNCSGLRVKFEFLKREKHGYSRSMDVSVEGGVLRVFPVEFVLKNLR